MTRTILISLTLGLLFTACNKTDSYKITIKTNQHNDKTAYLIRFEENAPIIFDSASWNNGYVFQGDFTSSEMVHFQISNSNENTSFFMDKGEFTIHTKDNSAEIESITGSKINTNYIAFLDSTQYFAKKNQEMYDVYQQAQIENNTKALDSIRAIADMLYESEQTYAKDAALKNLNTALGLYIIRSKIVYTMNYDDLNEILSKIPETNKNNPYFEYLTKHSDKLSKTRVGQIAPDFTMKDTAGNDIALKDFRGNYVMIDFWASWCGPCRRANPHVVKIFTDYNPKGFQILGVSFDKSREAWIKAIHDDQLTWPHVSDLQGWKNAAGQIYGINSIPHTTLIDPNGIIVANRFGHEELRTLLESAYKH